MVSSDQGLRKQQPYNRWIWEGLKIIGGGSIAALFPLFITIVKVETVLDNVAKEHEKDLQRIELSLRELRLQNTEEVRECRDSIAELRDKIHRHEVNTQNNNDKDRRNL